MKADDVRYGLAELDAQIQRAEQLRLGLERQRRQQPFWPERRQLFSPGRPNGAPERRSGFLTVPNTTRKEGGGLMAYHRLALRIPGRCTHCNRTGRMKPVQTIKGTSVLLSWHCEACDAEWPITTEEQQEERRRGQPDTRPLPRKERRRA